MLLPITAAQGRSDIYARDADLMDDHSELAFRDFLEDYVEVMKWRNELKRRGGDKIKWSDVSTSNDGGARGAIGATRGGRGRW